MIEKKIKGLFKEYYLKAELNENLIDNIDKREFAIWNFNSNTLLRHISFKNIKDLKNKLIKNPPLHVYFSSAIYKNPSFTQMDLKQLIYTDLIFDIDIDHIKTSCKENHDQWICKSCKKTGIGIITKCDNCGSLTIEKKSFICNDCLKEAKEQVFKLIDDFIISDFGLSNKEVKIFFSGNRGYHIHITNDLFRKLNSRERSMIVDYIKGISAKMYFTENLKNNNFKFRGIGSYGFVGRIAEKIFEKISKAKIEDLEKLGLSNKTILKVINQKEKILAKISRYNADFSFLKYFRSSLNYFINECISELTVDIDERVTVDMHRLIRMPNSIHGKTGLRVTPLSYSDLENFEPFNHSIIFRNGFSKIKFKIKRKYPKIVMNNEEFDLNEIELKEIPIYLGLYLYLNGYANIEYIYT